MNEAALKNVKVSIRLTEEDYQFINNFPGKSFSDKMSNLIAEQRQDETVLQRMEKKLDGLQELVLAIMPGHAPGEVIEDKYKLIATEIKKNGFMPTKGLVVRMHQLNELTKQDNTLQDIVDMSRTPRDSDEENELIKDIIKEFKLQEMERVP